MTHWVALKRETSTIHSEHPQKQQEWSCRYRHLRCKHSFRVVKRLPRVLLQSECLIDSVLELAEWQVCLSIFANACTALTGILCLDVVLHQSSLWADSAAAFSPTLTSAGSRAGRNQSTCKLGVVSERARQSWHVTNWYVTLTPPLPTLTLP